MTVDPSASPSLSPRPVSADGFWEQIRPLAGAAEATHMPMIFTDCQLPGNPVRFANDAFATLTGMSRAAIVGGPLDALLAGVTDVTSLTTIWQGLRSGGPGAWNIPCRRNDGTEFMAAVFLSPLHDDQGVSRQHCIAFVELGGHAERMSDHRDAMHALYAQAPGFIAATMGPDHQFSFANASFKRFVAREHLEGRTVAQVLPEIVEQGFLKMLDDVYGTGEPFVGRGIPMNIVTPDTGEITTRYCDFVYQAVRDGRGRITGLFCEGYDVTKQRDTADKLATLQAQLIHVSRVNAMGTMAATLAHELNQPLVAIANYSAGIMRLANPASPTFEKLELALRGIEEAAQRAGEIIRNLREMTRRREPDRVPFDLHEAVGDCIRLVQVTVPPSIVITRDICADTPMAADRVQIQQVIINLLRNACDAVMAAPVKQVSVSVKIADNQLVVCICDTGPGVPIEVAERLFSWSESSKEGGMGLGLSISRTIVEAHRGRIWLENSGPAGSELCFSIPMQDDGARDGKPLP